MPVKKSTFTACHKLPRNAFAREFSINKIEETAMKMSCFKTKRDFEFCHFGK